MLISHSVTIMVPVVLTVLVIHEFTNFTLELGGESTNTGPPSHGEQNRTKAMIVIIVALILLTVPHAVGYTVDIVRIWIRYKVKGTHTISKKIEIKPGTKE